MKVTLPQLLEARPCLKSPGKQPERLVRRLVSERRVPYYKPAGRLVFDLDEIDRWIDAARVSAAS